MRWILSIYSKYEFLNHCYGAFFPLVCSDNSLVLDEPQCKLSLKWVNFILFFPVCVTKASGKTKKLSISDWLWVCEYEYVCECIEGALLNMMVLYTIQYGDGNVAVLRLCLCTCVAPADRPTSCVTHSPACWTDQKANKELQSCSTHCCWSVFMGK